MHNTHHLLFQAMGSTDNDISNYLSDNRDFLREWLLRHADSDWLRGVAEEAAERPEVITAAPNICTDLFACSDTLRNR